MEIIQNKTPTMINCDYYVDHNIIVDYIAPDGNIKQFKIDIMKERGYIANEDDDRNEEIDSEHEYKRKLELRMKLNTYQIMFYENGKWIAEHHKDKYKASLYYILKDLGSEKYIRCYKNVHAYKNE
jgi:hypothetical protein